MTSIYTKPLTTLLLLLVLITGLLYLQTTYLQENFISDQTFSSQKQFIENNIAKAKIGDAAIDF
jgi:hypothetical protein